MKQAIKKYWEKAVEILRNKNVVFVSPLAIFVLWTIVTKNIFAFTALVFWVLVIIANIDEES